jgi:SAM-dependent methyltransferase
MSFALGGGHGAAAHPYVDSALEHADVDALAGFLQHLHWGLFSDPDRDDDSPERYLRAAQAMTERVVALAQVADGSAVLDVGCGFGGTLGLLRRRHPRCRLAGVNVDHRQLVAARRLLGAAGVGFVTADGCTLPVASGSLDRVLAVECVFHFPSRKAFFAEAARVLRPGGVLALSDFLVAPGALAAVVQGLGSSSAGGGGWYGHLLRPLTSPGYQRLGRRAGLVPLVDDDVTSSTLPTYAALRRLARESDSTAGLAEIDALDALARAGHLGYHVLAFRRPTRQPE